MLATADPRLFHSIVDSSDPSVPIVKTSRFDGYLGWGRGPYLWPNLGEGPDCLGLGKSDAGVRRTMPAGDVRVKSSDECRPRV